jgi:glycosyltransferase involved in cell wall biosynthesis
VALVIDNAYGGGAEATVLALALGLANTGHRVVLCYTRIPPSSAQASILASAGVELISLARRSRWRLDHWWPLVRALRRARVEVLNSHLHTSNVWCSLLRFVRPNMRFVATEHSSWCVSDRRSGVLDRLVVGRSTHRFVAVSTESARRLELVGVPATKVTVIRNGSSRPIANRQDPEVRRLRRELGAEGELLVGSVSMLRPQKRIDLLIDAFAAIERRHPTARLVVVGDGPERPALQCRVARLGLRRVQFLGHRDDVGALLAAFDIFAISSDAEGSPLALIDAMRAGLGLVATTVGGIPEMAPHGDCAVLVPPNDADALATGIARLVQDRELRERLGSAARDRAEQLFLVERMVDDWSDLFHQLADDRDRRARPRATGRCAR